MKRKLSSLIAAVFIGIGAFSCICQAAGMDIDKEDGEYSIQVEHVEKSFRVFLDKGQSFKERLLFRKHPLLRKSPVLLREQDGIPLLYPYPLPVASSSC